MTTLWKLFSYYIAGRTILIVAAMLLSAGIGQAEVRLILSHHVPTTHVIHAAAERFATSVEEKTGGEVVIEIRPAGQLFGMEEAAEALNFGTLDFAWTNISALQRWVPAMGFASMPFLFEDGDHANLMRLKGGIYRRLVERQAAGVRDDLEAA